MLLSQTMNYSELDKISNQVSHSAKGLSINYQYHKYSLDSNLQIMFVLLNFNIDFAFAQK